LKNDFHRTALGVSVINTTINALLAIGKTAVALSTHSEAVLSDGVHSFADTLSGIVLMVGIWLSQRRADTKHPYGHERLECEAAVILAGVIGVTGCTIGASAIESLLSSRGRVPPAVSAIWISLAAIAVKEIMFRYTRLVAKRTGSSALLADAWHHRTDALSSVGSTVGVVGACMGYVWFDAAAGVLISSMILKAAVDIFVDATRKMTDRACSDEFEYALCKHVYACESVERIEELKTRLFGNRVCAEITVAVSGSMTSKEAFDVVQTLQKTVRDAFPEIKDCSVHIHPL